MNEWLVRGLAKCHLSNWCGGLETRFFGIKQHEYFVLFCVKKKKRVMMKIYRKINWKLHSVTMFLYFKRVSEDILEWFKQYQYLYSLNLFFYSTVVLSLLQRSCDTSFGSKNITSKDQRMLNPSASKLAWQRFLSEIQWKRSGTRTFCELLKICV